MLITEGQSELAGNFRPKFAEHIETSVAGNTKTNPPRCGSEAAFVVWMIDVAKHDSARRPQPLREIEHRRAILTVRHNGVFHSMEEASTAAALG